MIPSHHGGGGQREEETFGPEVQQASDAATREMRQEVAEALRAEARALRAESELRMAAATAAASAARRTPAPGPTLITADDAINVDETPAVQVAPARRGVVLQLLPQTDVTEPISVRARATSRGRRGGVALRTVVLALIAGASITLSAQAVMRRPSAPPTVSAAAATKKRLEAPVPVKATVIAPSSFAPTVVASTATAPQPQAPLDTTAPAATPRKRVRARSPLTATRATSPKLRHDDATTWVDPFAGPAASTAKPAATAWVDPFVD